MKLKNAMALGLASVLAVGLTACGSSADTSAAESTVASEPFLSFPSMRCTSLAYTQACPATMRFSSVFFKITVYGILFYSISFRL